MTLLNVKVKYDWETFAKRLLVAQYHGIHIYQEDGHRWIVYDMDCKYPIKALVDSINRGKSFCIKEYGSFNSALNTIDDKLNFVGERTLLERFSDINYYDDLSNIFDGGVQ